MSSAFPPSAPVHAAASSQNLSQSLDWNEAFREFSRHLQATRAKKTQRYSEVQVGGLIRWATRENVPFAGFGKRHIDRFLILRAEEGCAPMTIHHSAVCAKVFFP
jgi:hypothetical protein